MPFHRRSIRTKPNHFEDPAKKRTHAHFPAYKECEGTRWVEEGGGMLFGHLYMSRFQFIFRFICTHVRHLLFAQSLMLFHSPFINTIQIINSIHHHCAFSKELQKREPHRPHTTKVRTANRFAWLCQYYCDGIIIITRPSVFIKRLYVSIFHLGSCGNREL